LSDRILPYYSRELTFIRRLGAEFARENPKIAGRLRLAEESVDDPHVARLIESFAFLNARIRRKLDDDFPELTHALLSTLYPHYLAPVPSMSIVQFDPQEEMSSGQVVKKGELLETSPVDGEMCRFRTCYRTDVWPIEIEKAKLTGRPLVAPKVPVSTGAVASLWLGLRCITPDVTFAALSPSSLRFYIRGQAQHVFELYELILNNCVGVALARGPDDPEPYFLRPTSVKPVGFARDEGMLPYKASSFPGYRLLTEFFVFPRKFLFFEITDLPPGLGRVGEDLQIFIYLDRASTTAEQSVTKETFALGCTPMVNLFSHVAEPIRLTHTHSEYRVVPDSRRPMGLEAYSVDAVVATAPDGHEQEFMPFYSVRHAAREGSPRHFWYANREPAANVGRQQLPGTEVSLTLVDLDFQPSAPQDWTIVPQTTCLNRDLPARLPFGGGQPYLQFAEAGAAVGEIRCLTPPTPTLRPPLQHGALWRLVSHLTLNHLSLEDGERGTEALREILRLYDFRDSAETRGMIDGLLNVECRGVAGRVPARRRGGICRGVEVRACSSASSACTARSTRSRARWRRSRDAKECCDDGRREQPIRY
jgi:type VI secretion system protein ImpG